MILEMMKVDSYVENGRQWVARHECEFGGNGSFNNCRAGKNITENYFNRGCWGGILIEKYNENEVHN